MKIGISIAILLIWTGSLHAQTDVIVDGTFDAGTTPWNFTSPPWNITTYYSCYDMEPGYAYFGIDGGGCNSCSGNLYQTVTIPSCASSATLGFHLSMSTDETGSTEYDFLYIQLVDPSSGTIYPLEYFSNASPIAIYPSTTCAGYGDWTYSIPSSHFGSPINVNFYAVNDVSNPTMFRLDDVSLTYTSTPPAAPSSLTGTSSCTSVALNWSSVSGASTYDIFNCSTGISVATGLSSTSYTVTGLSPCTPYSFEVRATSPCGTSSFSTCFSGTTLCAPATPSSLTATTPSCTSVALTWPSSASGATYDVYNCTSGSSVTSGISTTNYTVSGLTSCSAYSYEVRATNTCGSSPFTACQSGTTPCPPSVPTGLTATATSCDSISLSWTTSTGATSYSVYDCTTLSSVASSLSSASYYVTSLSPCTTYSYKVNATNTCGSSAFAACQSATTPCPPTAPTGLSATPTSSSTIALMWSAVIGALTYDVYDCTSGSLIAAGITTTSYNVTGLPPVSLHNYKVLANNACGSSPFSACASATTLPPTKTPEISDTMNGFTIYPNPSSGIVFVNLEKWKYIERGEICIINSLGQKISSKQLSNTSAYSFNIAGQSDGIYTIKIVTPNETMAKKFQLIK